jgi:hypothetical protein
MESCFSAGTDPNAEVHPLAAEVMDEVGISRQVSERRKIAVRNRTQQADNGGLERPNVGIVPTGLPALIAVVRQRGERGLRSAATAQAILYCIVDYRCWHVTPPSERRISSGLESKGIPPLPTAAVGDEQQQENLMLRCGVDRGVTWHDFALYYSSARVRQEDA